MSDTRSRWSCALAHLRCYPDAAFVGYAQLHARSAAGVRNAGKARRTVYLTVWAGHNVTTEEVTNASALSGSLRYLKAEARVSGARWETGVAEL